MQNLQLSPPEASALEPITLAESQRMVALEATIQKGRAVFLEVAVALSEIRDARLYRSDYPTFELYCREKWGFTKTYANNLIAGAAVVKALPEHLTTNVVTEGQARALARVPEGLRAEVLEAATQTGQKLTAETIRTAAAEKVIVQAARDIRMEKQARRAPPLHEMEVPAALHPINADDRKLRLAVNQKAKLYLLAVGPNSAGVKLPAWWREYQHSQEYQAELQEADALEKEARRLEAGAREIREYAIEQARQNFIAEHGTPSPYVETFEVPFQKDKLPKAESEAAAYLLAAINSGQIKPTENGCWGEMTPLFPIPCRPNASGWAKAGSPGWLKELFPNIQEATP